MSGSNVTLTSGEVAQRVVIYQAPSGESSDEPAIVGAQTAYTEDAAAASNPVGQAIMLVREDARAGSLTTTDGDNVALRGNNKGEAYVKDTDVATALALLAPNTTAGGGIAPVVSGSLETGKVIKASAGNLYRLNLCGTTVAGIFLVHNAASVPAAGPVTPVKAYPVGIGQAIEVEFNPPLRLGTGISVSFTSAATPFTQTDSATAFISGDAV